MSIAGSPIGLAAAAAFAVLAGLAAGPADANQPPSKEWRAWENRMPTVRIEPGKTTLLIAGQVETSNGAVQPVLRQKGERAGDAEALEFELELVKKEEAGTTEVAYRDVEQLFIIPMRRYKRIYILYDGAPIDAEPIRIEPTY